MNILEAFPVVCLMVAIACAIGIATGYPAAHWIGQKFAEVLSCLPTEKFLKAPPALGIPATRAIRGDLEGAVEGYEDLLLEHPHEKEIYFRLLEIALGPMHASEYGDDVLQRGLMNLQGGSERLALLRFSQELKNGEFRPFKHLGLA